MNESNEQMNLVPDSLKNFVFFDEEGYVVVNQKLPNELESDYIAFIDAYYTNGNNKVVNNIISKINELPIDVETTIAKLVDYKPDVAFVSPLTQGIILNEILKKCKNSDIQLEETNDEFGGLPYYIKFKKVNSKTLV